MWDGVVSGMGASWHGLPVSPFVVLWLVCVIDMHACDQPMYVVHTVFRMMFLHTLLILHNFGCYMCTPSPSLCTY